MSAKSLCVSAAAALTAAVFLAIPTTAGAADINIYGPRPVVVAPAPRVYVAPARTVVVTPRCVTHTARV